MPQLYETFFRYLDTVGDGSGVKNAVGNYVTGQEFSFKPARPAAVERMVVHIEDTGALDADSYGNGITFANGITVKKRGTTGDLVDLTDGLPIQTNGHWARLCYDTDVATWGIGNEFLRVRWTFTRAGYPIVLEPGAGEYFALRMQDTATALVSHYFMVQGYWLEKGLHEF